LDAAIAWKPGRELASSLLVILPLLAFYEVTLALYPLEQIHAFTNGGYWILVALSNAIAPGYFNMIVLVAVGVAWLKTRAGAPKGGRVGGLWIIAEGFGFGILLLVMNLILINGINMLTASMTPPPEGWLGNPYVMGVFMSAGAGVYEEILFRMLLMHGLLIVLRVMVMTGDRDKGLALAVAIAISSLLFSLAHHLGGEPIAIGVVMQLTLAGALLGWLYATRGLGVAVWAHCFYDVTIFWSRV
jgi:membrane protease YdiL (CAAX protease family)